MSSLEAVQINRANFVRWTGLRPPNKPFFLSKSNVGVVGVRDDFRFARIEAEFSYMRL